MASQLAIEITLDQAANVIYTPSEAIGGTGGGTAPTYGIGNVNLIPEILQFDASYGNPLIYFKMRCFYKA